MVIQNQLHLHFEGTNNNANFSNARHHYASLIENALMSYPRVVVPGVTKDPMSMSIIKVNGFLARACSC